MTLQPSLNLLLAQRLLPDFDTRRLVNWAVEAIADGYETESLSVLASMDGDGTPARDQCFRAAVRELRLSTDAEPQRLLRSYATYLARQVTNGRMASLTALKDLEKIYAASDYDSRYQPFYLLAEDLASLRAGRTAILTRDLHIDNVDNVIAGACAEFLEWEAININPHRWGAVYCFSCRHVDTPADRQNWLGGKPKNLVCRHCGSGAVGDFASDTDRERILEVAGNEPQGRHEGLAQP